MNKSHTDKIETVKLLNATSALKSVDWQVLPFKPVVAFNTTRLPIPADINDSAIDVCQSAELKGYQGFNLGLHVGDSREQVLENRHQLVSFLSRQSSGCNKIQWLDQVHGNHVQIIDSDSYSELPYTADGAYTSQANIALAVMTADCLPILLTTTDGDEIAAVHGGWRSLESQILTNAIDCFKQAPANIMAWLGPCIGSQAFEVGIEVMQKFLSHGQKFAVAFKPVEGKADKYLADLHQIATIQLQQLGVTTISQLAECTFNKQDTYYSYRREQTTGRMATVICLTE